MSSNWLPLIRKYSQDPLAIRFKALAMQLAQYDAHQAQIEATDLPNAMRIDNSIVKYSEDSKLVSKSASTKFYLPAEPDLQHLTLWLKFDSWDTSIKDSSFFNNDGLIQGGSPLGTNGPDKGYGPTVAFGFDGTAQLVDVFDNPTLTQLSAIGSFGTTSFTQKSFKIPQSTVGFSIACLFYPSTFSPDITGQFRYICSKVDDPNNMFALFLDPQGQIHFWVYRNGISYSVVSNVTVTVKTWNWIVATYNTANHISTLYLNGIIINTSIDIPSELPGPGGHFSEASTDLFIGSNSAEDGHFQGFMSDFRYYQEKVINLFEAQNLNMNYYSTSYIPFGQVLIISHAAINPLTSILKPNSLSFRQSLSQYVSMTSSPLLAVGESPGSQASYSAWFKILGNPAASAGICGKGPWLGPNGSSMAPYVDTNGTFDVDFNFNTLSSDFSFINVRVADGKWHHMVCSNNSAGNSQVYLDGIKYVDDHNGDYLQSSGAASFNIGDIYVGNYFNGQIADVRVYNVQLTQSEVTNLYNGINVSRGLVANWLMTEGSGSTITDSVNGIVGTLQLNPVWLSDYPPNAV